MTYKELVTRLARQTGLHSSVIRKVLIRLPDVLLDLQPGDAVRTPLGAFHMFKRDSRPNMLPDGTPARISEMLIVKLKPGARLRVGEDEELVD